MRRAHVRTAEPVPGIDLNDLCLFYQPFYNLSTSRVQGQEALLRRRILNSGPFLPASTVIPGLSEGELLRVDEWVARQASAMLAHWRTNSFLTETILAVNVSVTSLSSRGFMATLTHYISELGVPHDRILFDLPAMQLGKVTRQDAALKEIDELRTNGFTFCIDGINDFSLQSIDPALWGCADIVKLSPSLLPASPPGTGHPFYQICGTLHALDLPILVTGIETTQQLDMARSVGCEWAQGYLLGAPVLPTGTSRGVRH